ncbi:hypothetical protein AWU65_20280 [Paenibacillus glucanolyticus]|uniref:Uncharacterized protein n=1 Tax=Paenibacillus glucanolyticus TaxID=59843 RepID=A0A163LFY1_9BACL|nr:hypothetical protein [Paenibacillus glucanolyticus]KZS48096.1 hypothetical protein AWU65_20280 [Paenibacillus glucanolyticus]
MSRVLNLAAEDEVLDYCANETCGKEIYFGQLVTKIGHELVCSGKCLVEKIGAVTIIAGKGGV